MLPLKSLWRWLECSVKCNAKDTSTLMETTAQKYTLKSLTLGPPLILVNSALQWFSTTLLHWSSWRTEYFSERFCLRTSWESSEIWKKDSVQLLHSIWSSVQGTDAVSAGILAADHPAGQGPLDPARSPLACLDKYYCELCHGLLNTSLVSLKLEVKRDRCKCTASPGVWTTIWSQLTSMDSPPSVLPPYASSSPTIAWSTIHGLNIHPILF